MDHARLAHTPNTPEEVVQYLREAIPQLIDALSQLELIQRETHVAPAKPRAGMIRFADGTNWNPGSGRGVYFFNGTAWTLIARSAGDIWG